MKKLFEIYERNLALEAVRVTEAAALSASSWIGLGDEKAADAAARVAQIDSSKMRAKEFDRASENAKALASFEKIFYSDDDTADLKADPFLYSTFSISPVSFHRWRFAIPLHTMNTEIDLITMNANEHGRLFIGELMPEYIPLHGDYTDSRGKFWSAVQDNKVEAFLKAQEGRSKERSKIEGKRCHRDCEASRVADAKKLRKIDLEEAQLRKEKGWMPLEYVPHLKYCIKVSLISPHVKFEQTLKTTLSKCVLPTLSVI